MKGSLFDERPESGVRVALPVPVDELFDYSVPAALCDRARPGCRVHVRLSERPISGVIVETIPGEALRADARSIDDVIDAEPVISAAMLDILRQEAALALCPLGLAIQAALPPGSAPRRVRGYAISDRGREALSRGAARGAVRRLLESLTRGPLSESALRRRDPEAAERLAELERDRLVTARAVARGPAARERTERVVEVARSLDVEDVAAGALARAPAQAALLRQLAGAGAVPLRDLARERPRAADTVRALAERGFVRVSERLHPRDVFGEPAQPAARPTLTADQASAWKEIGDAVRAGRAESFLLHGVTGSGKTEVYLRAVEEALAQDRQALVLVPEITLTHQIVARLRSRFGDRLAVLHSGLRPGERVEQWLRLGRGDTPIAVGARSALFAPLDRLGVIVIDEEHDGAYKNDEGFRYHARRLALRRARSAGCPLVLGSATPSLETRYAADRGAVRRLVLPDRIGDRPLPAVEVVDLIREQERAPRGRKVILSRALRIALRETLEQGDQSILLLNRRGFSTQIFCFSCGRAERCPNCDVALVFHATDRRLRCHYCDHQMSPPERCPGCGTPDTALLGVGTQRVEEEVRSELPDARIERLDGDTARRRGHTKGVLGRLRDREVDVVVGTQILAKGHDFPGVRLVGVVLADVGLHLPDFRAAERTFQLLTQVAGRAGRDRTPGRVIVQTFSPDHYAVRHVRSHDYEGFYAEELPHRSALGYPPFGELVHVLVSAVEERAAVDAAAQLRACVDDLESDACRVLGPAPAPLARLRGRHRVQLLVKGNDRAAVRSAALRLRDRASRLPSAVQATVDPNPTQLL